MIARADVAIVGGGIVGAGLAAAISGQARVVILESESQAGRHSTGRSAAFWSESYGGPLVQPLTSASGAFLASPPADFAERAFLTRRGAVHIGRPGDSRRLDGLARELASAGIAHRRLDPTELKAMVPSIRPDWTIGLLEPSCSDIDVAALHQAFLRRARQVGARLICDAEVRRARREGGEWRIETAAGEIRADRLVNAAGAWADHVAEASGIRPIGIEPRRRTVSQLRVAPAVDPSFPLVLDVAGRFYFKPEAGGRLWLSPCDETPSPPTDSAAEEQDVAIAIQRLEEVTDLQVLRVERSWAGLRSFAPDRLPVFGPSAQDESFFWCAGQGGFGIQTSPAASLLAAALLLGTPPDPMVAGIDPAPYSAGRFAN